MTDAVPDLDPPLDTKAFLAGERALKPLHHSSVQWKTFAAGLGEAMPEAADMAQWSSHMRDAVAHPEWGAAHDAAHEAMIAAWHLVNGEGGALFSPEDMDRVERLFESPLPSSAQVETIAHAQLKQTLEPLTAYLTHWTGEQSPWRNMPTVTAPSTTPTLLDEFFASAPPSPGPIASRMSSGFSGAHRHDASCQHLHWTSPGYVGSSKGGNSIRGGYGGGVSGEHIHGPDCGHLAETKVKKSLYWWVGGAVLVGVVYFISQYGKKAPLQPVTEKDKPWTERLEHAGVNPPIL